MNVPLLAATDHLGAQLLRQCTSLFLRTLDLRTPTPPPPLRGASGRLLNERWREGAFPAGTFVANVTGSVALGLLYYGAEGSLRTGWDGRVLKGFEGGFLGCLTTMSSFVGEVVGHREKYGLSASYGYLSATAVSSLLLVLVVGVVLGG